MCGVTNMCNMVSISATLLWIVVLTNASSGAKILDGLKTGTLYQFELSTRTTLTDRSGTKTVDEQESSALVFVQILRSDEKTPEKRVMAVWADNCVNLFCPTSKQKDGSSGPMQLFAIWSGSKITEILTQSSLVSENWDLLRSFLFNFQYELDTAKLRPAGLCDSRYSDVDPVSRRLTFCKLAEQTFIIGKTIDFVSNSNFTQTSQYFFDASSKLRQMLVKEQYELSSPFFPDANCVLLIETRSKLVDQSQSTYNGNADASVEFGPYVEVLKKENGLQHLSDSVEDLFTNAATGEIAAARHESKDQCGALGGMKNLKRLLPTAKPRLALKTVVGLAKDLRSVGDRQILDCLDHIYQRYNSLIKPFLTTLAVSGKGNVQDAVFRFLAATPNVESARESYLIMLSHNLWPKNVFKTVVKQVEQSVDEYLALAVASLARRSEDKESQDRMLKLLNKLASTCKSDPCLETTFEAFRNLAHPQTADHVGKYFCHETPSVAKEALESLRSVDPKYWTNETIQDLARVYANECPKIESDITSRTIAAEMLMKIRPGRRWVNDVAPALFAPLKSGKKLWRTRRDREVYTYTLKKLNDFAAVDKQYKTAVNTGIRDILRNDYSRLAYGGLSTSHTSVPIDLAFGRATSQINMEYYRGVPKRANLQITGEAKNGLVLPVMSFGLFSDGLDSFVGEVAVSSEDLNDTEERPDPTAGMKLTILDHVQPSITFFTGQSELMSAVWSAGGDPKTAFEGRFLLNDMRGVVPLANGQKIVVDIGAGLWWKMSGSAELSMWYMTSHSVIAAEVSGLISGGVTLRNGGNSEEKAVLVQDGSLSGDLRVDFETDVDIGKNPFKLCLQMNHHPMQLNYKTRHVRYSKTDPKKQAWRRQKSFRVPGHCVLTIPKIARECSAVLQSMGRE